MKNIIAGLILLILGGFMVVFTHAMLRFQVWSQRTIMGAQYIPTKRTYTAGRIIGVLLAILGLIISIGIIK